MGEVDATRGGVDREQAELAELGGVVARDPDRELPRVAPLDVPIGERAVGQDLRVRAAVRPVAEHQLAAIGDPGLAVVGEPDRAVPPGGRLPARPDGRTPHRAVAGGTLRVVGEVEDGRPGLAVDDAADQQPPADPAGQLRGVVAGDRLGAPVPDPPDVDVGAGGAVGGPGREREARPVRRVAGGGADDHDVAGDLDGAVGPRGDVDAGRRLGGLAGRGLGRVGRRGLGRRAAPWPRGWRTRPASTARRWRRVRGRGGRLRGAGRFGAAGRGRGLCGRGRGRRRLHRLPRGLGPGARCGRAPGRLGGRGRRRVGGGGSSASRPGASAGGRRPRSTWRRCSTTTTWPRSGDTIASSWPCEPMSPSEVMLAVVGRPQESAPTGHSWLMSG